MDVKESFDFLSMFIAKKWLNMVFLDLTTNWDPVQVVFTQKLFLQSFFINILRGHISRGQLRYEINFWNVHGIMNTSGLLQSKSKRASH